MHIYYIPDSGIYKFIFPFFENLECCIPAGEETHDISSVAFDMDLADAVLSGYREQARGFLTDAEKAYLYDAVRLITYEQALRFFLQTTSRGMCIIKYVRTGRI